VSDPVIIREWNAFDFHQRVLEYEKQGYTARRETYRIMGETNPETGEVIQLYMIEMLAPEGS